MDPDSLLSGGDKERVQEAISILLDVSKAKGGGSGRTTGQAVGRRSGNGERSSPRVDQSAGGSSSSSRLSIDSTSGKQKF